MARARAFGSGASKAEFSTSLPRSTYACNTRGVCYMICCVVMVTGRQQIIVVAMAMKGYHLKAYLAVG